MYMHIEAFQGDIYAQSCDLLVLPFFSGTKRLSAQLQHADTALRNAVASTLKLGHFEGKEGERLTINTLGELKARHVVFLGLGQKEKVTQDSLRKFGGQIVKIARELKASSVFLLFPLTPEVPTRLAAHVVTEGFELGAYRFHSFKGTQFKKDPASREIKRVRFFVEDAKSLKMVTEGIEKGRAFAEATILARDLVNTPSADMTPAHMAKAAQSLVTRGSGIKCKVLDQKAMEKMGMGGALAVARGSIHPPVGIHLSYRPAKAKKRIAIVGKAVTFDSGGLSIKPSDGMMTMKIDMAGAAAVIGLFKLLPILKPNVEVEGIFLAVENMPSGTAYRPGDVVTAMDGTTIEVLNTDAEGRVTLADALTYALQQEPDMVIDLATLTGACIVALGEDVAAILSNNDQLTQKLLTASKEAGEPLWELPLYMPYAGFVKSKIADIKNIGGGHGGGVITAALFLKTFIDDTPWAHLDIAGPSYTEREVRPEQPYGASGYGVRLLANFLSKL